MHDKKFNPDKLARLNDPERLILVPPEIIRERIGLKSTDTILDIGAGTGFFSKVFTEMAADGKVYALDISDVMLDWLKAHMPPSIQNLIPMKMGEDSIDLPGETADFIYMLNLHHELEDPVKMLRECYRLLKPGGKTAVIDFKRKKTKHGSKPIRTLPRWLSRSESG